MPGNIEIKARIDSVEALLPRALQVTGEEPAVIDQDDIFFAVPRGRLKLRQFTDGRAELIHCHRADNAAALARACGLRGRVRKRRWLSMAGATRSHLDRVEGLGDFIELEVVLSDGQSEGEGVRIAEGLMQSLGLADAERLASACLDVLDLQAGLDGEAATPRTSLA